jgi:hypothetical protein
MSSSRATHPPGPGSNISPLPPITSLLALFGLPGLDGVLATLEGDDSTFCRTRTDVLFCDKELICWRRSIGQCVGPDNHACRSLCLGPHGRGGPSAVTLAQYLGYL